jgi:hypothetical protein
MLDKAGGDMVPLRVKSQAAERKGGRRNKYSSAFID